MEENNKRKPDYGNFFTKAGAKPVKKIRIDANDSTTSSSTLDGFVVSKGTTSETPGMYSKTAMKLMVSFNDTCYLIFKIKFVLSI